MSILKDNFTKKIRFLLFFGIENPIAMPHFCIVGSNH